jgi:hypothetical protein
MVQDALTFGKLRQPLGRKKKKSIFGKIAMLIKILHYVPLSRRDGKSAGDFVPGFASPGLRQSPTLITIMPDLPAASIMGLLSMLHTKEAGRPEGGSPCLARSLE